MSSSSKENSGGIFKYPEEFKNETKHTLDLNINNNSNHIPVSNSNHITSPDLCSQFNNIKKKKVVYIHNPSLWAEFKPSAINSGHGVVKRVRAFEKEIGEKGKESVGPEKVAYKPEVGSQ